MFDSEVAAAEVIPNFARLWNQPAIHQLVLENKSQSSEEKPLKPVL